MSVTKEEREAFTAKRGCRTDVLAVKRLNEGATIPQYGSDDAAGLDLYANMFDESYNMYALQPGERKLFKTGIAIAIPPGHFGNISPRSGLALKYGLDLLGRKVDSDYRGDIGIILLNTGQSPIVIQHGDRIAQLIIESYTPCLPYEVDVLPDTARGGDGFGSTGV